MITAASDQRAYDALCDALSDEPREDICPTCGIECECRGPYVGETIADVCIAPAISASPPTRLTPAVSYEADTEVVEECTAESHEALKRSPLWFGLEYVGIQHDTDEDGRDASLTMRNCGHCGSTLCRPATSRERLVALLCKHIANDEAVTAALALADAMAVLAMKEAA